MAFGSWMKKLSDNVKAFGRKVKDVAQKAMPVIKNGVQFMNEKAGPALSKFGEAVGGEFGNRIKQTGDNVTKWSGMAQDRFIKPLYDSK